MKKFNLIFVILVLISTCAFSQTLTVDWGSQADFPKNCFYHKIIGFDKDGFYAVRSKGEFLLDKNNLWLDYFSSATKTLDVSNQIIMPTVNGVVTDFEEMYYLQDKLVLFSSINDKAKQKKSLYVQHLNQNGTLSNKSILVGEMSLANSDEEKFDIQLSGDKENFMVCYHNTFTKYTGIPFNVKVYDINLKEVYSGSLELPLKDRTFDVVQYALGKSGNIYMSAKLTPEGKKKGASKVEKFDRMIIAYDVKKNVFNTYDLKLEKFVPGDVLFSLDKTENIVVFGFFYAKTGSEFAGIFYQRINPRTIKVENSDLSQFPKEGLSEFSNPRNGETPEQLHNFKLNDILFLENGAAFFVTEQSYMTFRTMVDPKTKAEEYIYYYNYNDLVTAFANKDGKLEWTLRIPKNQKSLNDNSYFLSYLAVAAPYGNKVKLFFNDTPANLNSNKPEEIKEMKRPAKGLSTIVTIYGDGTVDKARMFASEDIKFIISPHVFIQTPDNYIIMGQDGKSYKFGSFIFE